MPSSHAARSLDARLFEAVKHKEFALAKELLAQGARADVLFGDENALFLAATLHEKWTRLLLPGAQPDSLDSSGYSPLMLAAKYSNAGAVSLLLQAGADPWLLDCDGEAPLTWLIRHGSPENPSPSKIARISAVFELFAHADPKLLHAEIGRSPQWAKDALSAVLSRLEAGVLDQHAAPATASPTPRL